MKSPLQALLQMGVVPSTSFPTDSRYYNFSTLTYMTPTGEQISYLSRRIVPQPGPPNFATVATHTVHQGDRLDLIAAKYLGDPLMFWLICDANGAIEPEKLVRTPGTVVNITTPIGVPGAPTHA
jgi:nucleoid-associated protein YgaU